MRAGQRPAETDSVASRGGRGKLICSVFPQTYNPLQEDAEMLEKFGYIKETIKRYDMTMGDLILLISRKLFEAGKSDIEIRLLNTFSGELDKFSGVPDMISSDWNTTWEISVYSIRMMTENLTGNNFVVAVFSDRVASIGDAE